MFEEVPALFVGVEVGDVADGLAEGVDGPGADSAQVSLELGEGHFDRIEIGAVGRQEEEPCAAFPEDGLGFGAFVAGEVVEDDHVTLAQGRSELGLDVGIEGLAVHRVVDHPWRGQAIAAQAGNEGLGGPVSERRIGLQSGAATRPAAQAGHLRRRAGLIEEDQSMAVLAHERLAMRFPLLTRLTHVFALGLRGQQSFF